MCVCNFIIKGYAHKAWASSDKRDYIANFSGNLSKPRVMHITPVHRIKSCSCADFALLRHVRIDPVKFEPPLHTRQNLSEVSLFSAPEKHHLFLRWRVEDQALSSESLRANIFIFIFPQWRQLCNECCFCMSWNPVHYKLSVRDKCEMKTEMSSMSSPWLLIVFVGFWTLLLTQLWRVIWKCTSILVMAWM